jgi:hypothetical protein
MSSTPAKHYVVARVLLMSDQRRNEPGSTDGQKASVLSISRRTVIRDPRSGLSKRTWGWLLPETSPENAKTRRCLDGKGEAQLIHLACSKAPDGRERWTLELLADQMARLEYVEHISPETVRKTLKKRAKWCIRQVQPAGGNRPMSLFPDVQTNQLGTLLADAPLRVFHKRDVVRGCER